MRWIVAVEGGASHTRAALYTPEGVEVKHAAGGPANPVEYGGASCVLQVAALLRELAAEPVAVLAAGLSGSSREPVRAALARGLAECCAAERVLVADDLRPTLFANARSGPAVAVIAGTGASILAQGPAGEAAAGGRGRLFGEEGSAYAIAEAGLRAAARAADGAGPATCLGEMLPQAVGFDSLRAMVRWAAEATKEQVAALAPVVTEAADHGDAVARRCITRQAAGLAWRTAAAARRAGISTEAPVYCSGALLTRVALFRETYERALHGEAPRLQPLTPPLAGPRAIFELARAPEAPTWVSAARSPQDGSAAAWTSEIRLPAAEPVDALSSLEIVRRMCAEDAAVPAAVARQAAPVAEAIDAAARALRDGGRILYIGAGTSGRLGVLDASECPPTFGVSPDRVIGIMAGGDTALRTSVEGAEDDAAAGVADIDAITPPLDSRDVVVGITASGRTPYTLAALRAARERGARTVLVCCNPSPSPTPAADIVVCVETGPEVVAGSTRLKAGAATKLVLNMLSTGAMARAGFVYEGCMVGMRPSNVKLRRRAIRMLRLLTGLDAARAEALLDRAEGRIPVAVLMARHGLDAPAAARRLNEAKGSLRDALDAK